MESITQQVQKAVLRYPYLSDGSEPGFEICYDTLLKDYKVVVYNEKHYAVFYWRKNLWSEKRESSIYFNSAHLKGSVYWVRYVREEDRHEA